MNTFLDSVTLINGNKFGISCSHLLKRQHSNSVSTVIISESEVEDIPTWPLKSKAF
jgi:hypothetical protein